MHMPERGHWEHTLDALRKVLDGLKAQGFRSVTLSTLVELAEHRRSPTLNEIAPQPAAEEVDQTALATYPGWPVGGFKAETIIADNCTEDHARSTAFRATLSDPEHCICSCTYWWTPFGGHWCTKAFTLEPGRSVTFEKRGRGQGYMVYHDQALYKPVA